MSGGMSSDPAGSPEEPRLGPQDAGYIPTDEEKRVFAECSHDAFWYRSVPMAVTSVVITKLLMNRGVLTASTRLGSLSKLVFAGSFGCVAGQFLYMKTCREKFLRLENSPIADTLRRGRRLSTNSPRGPPSELGDPDSESLNSMFQPGNSQSQIPHQRRDYNYDSEQNMPTSRPDDFNPPPDLGDEEEQPTKKPILYEDLRLKNRENYEVTLTQKAETLLKPAPQREPQRPKAPVKTNIYGDTWEE